jgi:hypothetical protein
MLFIFGSWVFQALMEGRKKRAQRQAEAEYEEVFQEVPAEGGADTSFDTLKRQLREIGLDLDGAPAGTETRTSPPPPPPPMPQVRPGHAGHDHAPLQPAMPGSIQTKAPPPLTSIPPAPRPGRDRALEAARAATPPSAAEFGDWVTAPLPETGTRLISTLRPTVSESRPPSAVARGVFKDLRQGPESLARAIVLKEILGRPVGLQTERNLPS